MHILHDIHSIQFYDYRTRLHTTWQLLRTKYLRYKNCTEYNNNRHITTTIYATVINIQSFYTFCPYINADNIGMLITCSIVMQYTSKRKKHLGTGITDVLNEN